MTPELPQPFEQEDIRKDPKAVVIGLLIGLLLLCCAVIGILYREKEKQADRLYKTILDERNQRIKDYEQMIFYKKESEILQAREKETKQKTEPLIKQALQ